MRVLLTTASALALFAAPALALAQTNPPPPAGTNPPANAPSKTQSTATANPPPAAPSTNTSNLASQADQTFVKKATMGSLAEIQAGQLAAQKSRDPAVQEFGRWMQADYSMANVLLKQAAQSDNIQVPTSPNPVQTREIQDLQKMSGQQFDQKYINDEVTNHQQTLKLFQNEANAGQNQNLKAFAKDNLPGVQARLQEAQALSSQMSSHRTASGASGSAATGNNALSAGNAATARLNQQELNRIQHR